MSGHSADLRTLLGSGDPDDDLAVAVYIDSVAAAIAATATHLGGIDTLVFTGGIGEHSPEVRARTCRKLALLGVTIDEAANDANQPHVESTVSAVEVRVIASDEAQIIANHTSAMTHQPAPTTTSG